MVEPAQVFTWKPREPQAHGSSQTPGRPASPSGGPTLPERSEGPCPLPPPMGPMVPVSQQGCLTLLEKAAATWEISGSCGELAAGERPLSPPPSSRNCPLHIRKDRALERERMAEGVGRQVPSRSLGARSLRTARQPDPKSLTPGSRILPGMGCISAQGPGPHCGGWHLPGNRLCSPLSSPGGMVPGAREPQSQRCRARGSLTGSLQDRWDPDTLEVSYLA